MRGLTWFAIPPQLITFAVTLGHRSPAAEDSGSDLAPPYRRVVTAVRIDRKRCLTPIIIPHLPPRPVPVPRPRCQHPTHPPLCRRRCKTSHHRHPATRHPATRTRQRAGRQWCSRRSFDPFAVGTATPAATINAPSGSSGPPAQSGQWNRIGQGSSLAWRARKHSAEVQEIR